MTAPNAKSYVYILCNRHRNIVYGGSTSDLKKRVYFHKKGLLEGFTKKYYVDQLVYFEEFDAIADAQTREKADQGVQARKEKRAR